VTLIEGDSIRTGVTALIPGEGNLFQQKFPAAVYVGNGFGKLAGATQVQELGQLETPIILTNTLSVAAAIDGLISYTLGQPGNEQVRSANAVVGETNDGDLNDIRARKIKPEDILAAIQQASDGPVREGAVGAGTGTVCFEFKGGIGTASRIAAGYVVGVLVQTNFGGDLLIDGVPVARVLKNVADPAREHGDGSCMIALATNAPLDSRNLHRFAKRAFLGLAKTGGYAANGSGDYVIAFSTEASLRIPHAPSQDCQTLRVLHPSRMTPLFQAAVEATEEAIINSLFAATSMTGFGGKHVQALPIPRVLEILKMHNRLDAAQP
jgi:D-aminopeptidase